jgi:hypothetical protein
MLKTLALFSSARRNGNTGRLMDRIALELDLEVVDLSALQIAPYDYDHSNRHDDFEPLMERVLEHEQLIFASPVFIGALCENFDYLGMGLGGVVHVNCAEGYSPAVHDPEALAFATRLRSIPG